MTDQDRIPVIEAANFSLYTDGACQPNPGTGGWAFVLQGKQKGEQVEVVCSGRERETTNNRMELLSAINGMNFFLEKFWTGIELLTLFSDSQYTVKGLNLWIDDWFENDWHKKSGDEVLNADLWQKLYSLKHILKPTCIHVKGHAGHHMNERVDQLANKAIGI